MKRYICRKKNSKTHHYLTFPKDVDAKELMLNNLEYIVWDVRTLMEVGFNAGEKNCENFNYRGRRFYRESSC